MNSLDRRRQAAAQSAFENHIFPEDSAPESADGWTWTTPGNTWERTVYFPNTEDVDGPTVPGHFHVDFVEDTAVIASAYASIHGNDVGKRPKVSDEWDRLDENTWYRNLSPANLSQALAHESPMVSITLTKGTYWLHNADQPGETEHPTLEAAKAAGDRLVAISDDTFSDRMARDAGLDADQWTFHSDIGRSWFEHVDEEGVLIEFRRSGWAAIRGDEEFPEQSSAPEANALLERPPALKH